MIQRSPDPGAAAGRSDVRPRAQRREIRQEREKVEGALRQARRRLAHELNRPARDRARDR